MHKTLLIFLIASTVFGQSFIPHQVTGGADFAQATDLDGDGDIDILAANGPTDQIFWLENNGDSFFIVHQIESTADWPTSLIPTDWDGDGDLDVVSVAVRDNKINWYENDGNQSFSQHTLIVGIDANDIEIADIDNDGDMDIVASSYIFVDGIKWFENINYESFVEHLVNTGSYNSIFVSDIDDDGNDDIIVASHGGLSWWRNNGIGTFTGFSIFGNDLGYVQDAYAIDMDGDDDVDIVAACNNGVAWFANNGSETFTTNILNTDDLALYSLHVSDLNGDSNLDIITVDYGYNSVNWYESSGGSSPTFIKESLNSDEVSTPSSIVTVDIDGDWDIDVITACYNGLAVHENDGAADAPTFTTKFILPNSGQSVNHAVDVDGDGDMDLLTANYSTNKIAWHENNGNELFTSHTITTNALFPKDIYSVDMDMDGDIDILSASLQDDKIAWYENDGLETFTAHVIALDADRAYSVYAIDLDSDGDMDVLSASDGDNKIAWYENNGNQTFTSHEISLSAENARSVHTADFDGDGDMDVVSASYGDDKIAWYENIDGAFAEHIITPNADGAESAFAADLDADGDMDILSASSLDNRIAWYENDGSANFTPHNISTNILGANSVFAVDVDGDGTGYMIVFSVGTEEVTWFEYLGNGNFSAHNVTTGEITSREVNAVDVDGDGTVDVVAGSSEGLIWYENTIDVTVENLDVGGMEELQHIVSHTPTITWDYSDNMVGTQSYYRIQVSSTLDFSILDLWSTGVIFSTTSSITYSGASLMDGENYYVRVRAGSGAFWSEWQSTAFRMNAAPTAPQAISPINDEIVIEPAYLQVVNSVDLDEDPLTYSYWVYSDNLLTNLIDSAVHQIAGPDTSYWQVGAILENNSRYWWVAEASDGFESGAVSELSSFIIDTGNDSPSPFLLLNPIGMESVSILRPTFTWATSQDPDPLDEVTYTLIFDTPSPGIETFNIGTDTSYQVTTDLSDNVVYSWKVIASDTYGASTENAGGYQSFRVNTENDLPTDFNLIAPEDGSMVVDLTPTFNWTTSSDPDDVMQRVNNREETKTDQSANEIMTITGYQVYLDTDSLFTETLPIEVVNPLFTSNTNLVENMVYYWKVSALDDSGGATFSDRASFWTNSENSTPAVFTLLTPVDDTESTTTPTFTWTLSSDADLHDTLNYTLRYGTDVFNLMDIPNGSSTQFNVVEPLADNTNYIWQVVAEDISGATFATEFSSFFVNSQNDDPGFFSLIAPASASWITNPDLMLVWEPSTDLEGATVEYVIHLGPDNESLEPIDTIGVNYFALNALEDGYYSWQIEALDNLGGSQLSVVWSFLINAHNDPPDPFALTFPEADMVITEQQPTFTWEASSSGDAGDHTSYRLELGSTTENVGVVYEGDSTFYTPDTPLEDNSVYFWRVTAIDLAFATTVNQGGYQSFVVNTVNDAPTMAELISPDSVVVLSDTPIFHWNASTDVDPYDSLSYELHWWTDLAEMDSILTTATSVSPETPLANDNLQYFWNVITMDANGGIAHSEEKTFWVDFMPEVPASFALLGPDSASAGNGTRPELTWAEAIDPDPFDAVYYQVIVATDSLLEEVVHESVSHVESFVPEFDLPTDTRYYWQITAIDEDSLITNSTIWTFDVGYVAIDQYAQVPTEYMLDQNYPNPFNPSTTIRYGLPEESNVSLVIYDVRGQVVQTIASEHQSAGWYNVIWNGQTADGKAISTGLYFARIVAGDYSEVIKMLYLK